MHLYLIQIYKKTTTTKQNIEQKRKQIRQQNVCKYFEIMLFVSDFGVLYKL